MVENFKSKNAWKRICKMIIIERNRENYERTEGKTDQWGRHW